MSLNTIPEIIEDIRQGNAVILVDDEDRENEGDLIVASDFVTPQIINFMAVEARGLICLCLTPEQTARLDLPLMTKDENNRSPNGTAFTVSIEAAKGVTTGISAADRAHTIRVAASPNARTSDVVVPGHIFPIRAQTGGVLKRAGHTEASVDLARMAGLNPAAAICEIMNPDGTMARLPELLTFARKHQIKIGAIEELIRYRIENESFLLPKGEADLPSAFGDFKMHVFENQLDGREHIAIVKGPLDTEKPVLVRVHAECLMGDVFRSERTRSGEHLEAAMRLIQERGSGVIVYVRHGKVATEEFQLAPAPRGDERDYGIGAQILRALGVKQLQLITRSHAKRAGLKGYGLEIVDEV